VNLTFYFPFNNNNDGGGDNKAESLFSMFSFSFMLCYVKMAQMIKRNNHINMTRILLWWTGCLFSGCLATFTRSNGIVLVAYILHYIIINIYRLLYSKKKKKRKKGTINIAVVTIFSMIIVLCTAIPLVVVDQMGRELYCNSNNNSSRPWCGANGGSLYTFVQSEYWNQGLFHYWRLSQLPNFLLSFPILFSCFHMFYQYMYNNKKKIFTLQIFGLVTEEEERGEETIVPFVYHGFALSLLCFFCMHVQVATRFILASTPVVYWYWYDILYDNKNHERGRDDDNDEKKRKRTLFMTWYRRLLLHYIWIFNVVGIVLFSSFYPWT
jgi:Gpi18-like mannosyltransferase